MTYVSIRLRVSGTNFRVQTKASWKSEPYSGLIKKPRQNNICYPYVPEAFNKTEVLVAYPHGKGQLVAAFAVKKSLPMSLKTPWQQGPYISTEPSPLVTAGNSAMQQVISKPRFRHLADKLNNTLLKITMFQTKKNDRTAQLKSEYCILSMELYQTNPIQNHQGFAQLPDKFGSIIPAASDKAKPTPQNQAFSILERAVFPITKAVLGNSAPGKTWDL